MKDIIERIYEYSLEDMMAKSFGRYSKYIIQDRAIPDVRDGLKPVQRRILYSMYKDKYTYDKPYRKSARAVGDIMGKYHPHGDSSIYEAMVRMSQDWKMNTPFIDMQGNNGSIDGDSPAAMRYTEARLSKISIELLKDIEKNTVAMSYNYDDTLVEPTVLPAKYPNLLVNGTTGISAGYATNIPPHNLGEVIDATIYRIDQPNCRLETIMNIVKGPDFPTGGVVEGIKGIEDAYRTGRGKIVLKSKISYESVKGKDQIVITEIPYEVNKALLVRQIDEIRINKKIDGIVEVRDESDRNGLRIAIDVKKDANKELIVNYLLKNTDMQISYSFNMIAIVNRRPKLLGILDILDAYILHQKDVVRKRSLFDLETAKDRLHIVEGFIKMMDVLDEVIATIRKSKDKEDAQKNLMAQFGFTERQAIAIVTLQLYRLTNTDVEALKEELRNLNIIIARLNLILSDESVLLDEIKHDLRRIKKEYATDRKTEIKEEISEIKIDTTMMIPKDDVVVVVTKDGYVKRVSTRSYSASKEEDTLLKDNDYVIGMYEMNTTDTILIFTSLGNFLYVPVYEIPDTKWKELGKHISNIIAIKSDESIVGSMPVYNFDDEQYITTFTKLGMIKRTKVSDYKMQRYSKPVVNIKLKDNDEVTNIDYSNGKDVIVVTNTGYSLRFDMDEVPVTGIKSSGVKSINLKNDYVVNGLIINDFNENLTIITDKGTGKRIKLSDVEKQNRARRGLLIMKEVKTNPQQIIKVIITNTRNIIGLKLNNDTIKIKNSELPIMDRYSIGSSIVKDKVYDAYPLVQISSKEEASVQEVEEEKQVSLEEIDNQILTIDSFLKDMDSM
jgi:topoisomerase-4 subunit A